MKEESSLYSSKSDSSKHWLNLASLNRPAPCSKFRIATKKWQPRIQYGYRRVTRAEDVSNPDGSPGRNHPQWHSLVGGLVDWVRSGQQWTNSRDAWGAFHKLTFDLILIIVRKAPWDKYDMCALEVSSPKDSRPSEVQNKVAILGWSGCCDTA